MREIYETAGHVAVAAGSSDARKEGWDDLGRPRCRALASHPFVVTSTRQGLVDRQRLADGQFVGKPDRQERLLSATARAV